MKMLALLSIFLALPLAAQDQKPDVSAAVTASKQTVLTVEEHERLSLALMQAQAARIELLEALSANKAGNDQVSRSEEASKAYLALLQNLIKAHSACSEGQWNFSSKQWMCPPVPEQK